MKYVNLLAAAYVNGHLRQPNEGALHLTNEEADRLVKGGLATDVTDDFADKAVEEQPAEHVTAAEPEPAAAVPDAAPAETETSKTKAKG